ncbi:MAG: CPBP family intramembrane metalloprotease [Candidatus Zapsychrus exili]|nr:CPBP family intramembrane metalloprotease [Candidatus Zapsychrus exili]
MKKTSWIIFILVSILSLFIWHKYTYPQLAFINLSVDREEALKISKEYLKEVGVNPEEFKSAIIFTRESSVDRYLQKTIGFKKFKEFIKEHDFNMFLWIIRFFKENEKEEYRLSISSSNGEINSFRHTIDDSTYKEDLGEAAAEKYAITFLKEYFNFNSDEYTLHSKSTKSLDNRKDYYVSFRKNSVHIPWSQEKDTGAGKLIIGATISGKEALSFFKYDFLVPDQFNRYMDNKKDTGRNLSAIVQIFYTMLFFSAMGVIFLKRNHLAMHVTKKFYMGLGIVYFILLFLTIFNYFQDVFFDVSTSSSVDTYLLRHFINLTIGAVFAATIFIIPGVSGELLHFENLQEKKEGAFLCFIRSTFLSRSLSQSILLGYFVCIIMLGLQSLITAIGQKYMGVWVEYSWMGQLSTAYLPFLAALTIGVTASLSEETMYRLFSISLIKKFTKNIIPAVIISSLIWGFAHSSYPVFPMWFRGVEVTCLGLLLSYIYLSFGIVPVIIAHYLFDVFWNSSSYLLGVAKPFDFFSSLAILLLPLVFCAICFIANKNKEEKKLKWLLTKHQEFNLNILKTFIKENNAVFSNKAREEIAQEICSHGWDIAVVEVALDDLNY